MELRDPITSAPDRSSILFFFFFRKPGDSFSILKKTYIASLKTHTHSHAQNFAKDRNANHSRASLRPSTTATETRSSDRFSTHVDNRSKLGKGPYVI